MAALTLFLARRCRVVAVRERRQQDEAAVPIQRNGGQLEGESLIAGPERPRRADRHPTVLHFRARNILRLRSFCTTRIRLFSRAKR